MPEIRLEHVTKRFDKFYAVDDLNLVIKDNAFVTLLGPSGCGKTTTLRMIAGLETPTSGKITIDGVTVFDSEQGINVPANKRKVGFLFQNYALWPNMTVYKNISFGLENMKLPKEKIKARVNEMLKMLQLEGYESRYPSELSGGQQQRVAIARTLATAPKVLFMDEPLSNLDAKLRIEMRSELQRLHFETGSTFIYVTHDQLEAMTLATKICLIQNGELQQYDAPLDIYKKPKNLFVADFVGNPSINFIEATGEQTNDGCVLLDIFDGKKVVFTPHEKVNIPEWYIKMDAEEKAARDAESHVQRPEKSNKSTAFKYHIARIHTPDESDKKTDITEHDFILGVRPEFLTMSDKECLDGEIYSAMPTGMETMIKVQIGNYLITGVMFGGELYQIGQKIKFKFNSEDILLFSRKNGKLIARGSLTVKEHDYSLSL